LLAVLIDEICKLVITVNVINYPDRHLQSFPLIETYVAENFENESRIVEIIFENS
jgi:hypothetical protein